MVFRVKEYRKWSFWEQTFIADLQNTPLKNLLLKLVVKNCTCFRGWKNGENSSITDGNGKPCGGLRTFVQKNPICW